jgi:hypothetical protein
MRSSELSSGCRGCLVIATWREVATAAGATRGEIQHVVSVFEYNGLTRSLSF